MDWSKSKLEWTPKQIENKNQKKSYYPTDMQQIPEHRYQKMLYYAQIYSHLSYGLILWGNKISNTQLTTMQKLQNKAIKLVDLSQTKIESTYKTLEILKLNEAIVLENWKMMHKLEHNRLPGKLPLL